MFSASQRATTTRLGNPGGFCYLDGMASEKMSKKQFELYLNEHIRPTGNDGWGSGSGPRSRPYGTWFRNADRDAFNESYRLYLEEGQLPS
jgi:hypothetical protein